MLVDHMRGAFSFKMFVPKTNLLGHFVIISTKSGSCIMKAVFHGGLVFCTCTHPLSPFSLTLLEWLT